MFPYQKHLTGKNFVSFVRVRKLVKYHEDIKFFARTLQFVPGFCLFVFVCGNGNVWWVKKQKCNDKLDDIKFKPETKLNHLSHASRAAARKRLENANITWYSLPIATTVSTLCMSLLHHSWSNLVDSDIHSTTMTGIASYNRTLEITES